MKDEPLDKIFSDMLSGEYNLLNDYTKKWNIDGYGEAEPEETNEEKLDRIPVKEIEQYLRKLKLEKINNG